MRHLQFRWLALLSGIAVLGFLSEASEAAEPSGNEIYQRTLRSTCWVIIPGKGWGTGWVVDLDRRLIITNCHVVGDSGYVDVIFPEYDKSGKVISERDHYKNKKGPGYVTQRDAGRDLAIIRVTSIPREANQLKLASRNVGPGDRVHTVGNPGVSKALWVYTSGTVRTEVYEANYKSSDKAGVNVQNIKAQIFETQSPINPGDSGGPVVNDQGELVGVNSSHSGGDSRLVTQCINVSEVKKVLPSLPESRDNDADRARKWREEGSAALRDGEYTAAVNLFSAAIRVVSDNYLYYNDRGAAYTFLNKDPEAIKDFSKAILLNPKYAITYRNRGAAYYRLGKLPEAIADFTRAIEIDNRYARAYRGRGDAYTKLGNTREAQADYKKALELEQASK